MKQRVDEHDMTKKMLSTLREQKESLNELRNVPDINSTDGIIGALKNYKPEEIEMMGPQHMDDNPKTMNQFDDAQSEDSDTIEPNQEEMNAEYQKFGEVVNPRVQFTTFKIYPEANNVILGGKFQGMSGLEWQFSLEDEDGLYITVNNLQVDDSVISTMQKLKGYYDNWADEWSKKLATEYKNGNVQ